jgi:hypothetical protein
MAKPKNDNKHLATKVIFAEDNQEYALNDLCKKFEVNIATGRGRWIRAGRGPVITRETITGSSLPPRGVTPMLVTLDPYGQVSIRFIFRLLHEELHRGYQFFLARWNAFGKPETVTLEMFTMSNDEVLEKTGVNFWTAVRKGSRPADQRFLDPTFLPEIPYGDLEFLSSKVNTGAARKDADRWASRSNKGYPSFHGRCSSGDCFQGRQ